MVKVLEGDTEPLEFDLKRAATVGAEPEVFDATGMTVAATIKGRDKSTEVDTSGKVDWVDQDASRVSFTPAADDFLRSKSPYYLHFTVTDGNGDTASWPAGPGFKIVVTALGEA